MRQTSNLTLTNIVLIATTSLLLLTACSTKPKQLIPAHIQLPLEQLASIQAQISQQRLTQAKNALYLERLKQLEQQFILLDQLEAQWQVAMLLAKLEPNHAIEHFQSASSIAQQLKQQSLLFETTIALYLLTREPAQLTQAEQYASSQFQHYQVAYLQNRLDKIAPLPTANPSISEQAYVNYWLAKRDNSLPLATKALTQFKQTTNSIAIADSLYLIAQLQLQQLKTQKANDYSLRALRIYQILELTPQINQLQQWRSQHLSASE